MKHESPRDLGLVRLTSRVIGGFRVGGRVARALGNRVARARAGEHETDCRVRVMRAGWKKGDLLPLVTRKGAGLKGQYCTSAPRSPTRTSAPFLEKENPVGSV